MPVGDTQRPVRVLYSFPMKLGGARVDGTAWNQVNGLCGAGADVLVCNGVTYTPLPSEVRVWPTLSRGRMRISYKMVGRLRAFAIHDRIVAQRLRRCASSVDIVHVWPLAARHTLKAAAMLGIPTVYERPNAHTACFYESVERECKKLGVALPRNHEHATNVKVLAIEEEEYRLACRILCPSEYAASTFLKRGFNAEQLARHQYGFDETAFYPVTEEGDHPGGLAVLFAGLCAPIKGLHYGLEAWLRSPASRSGTFSIAGTFTPGYAEKLSGMLSHPSVRVLGHRRDLAEIMRRSDIFVAPSVSEGSALVTYEARGSGCVLLASRATGAICNHMRTGLLHDVGDSDTLARQISMLDADRGFLRALREESLKLVGELTWASAGRRLLEVYNGVLGTAGRRGQ